MPIKYDVIAKNGTYKDKVTNEERTNWKKVGVCMDTRSGGLAIKIDALPPLWDGWLQLTEPKAKDQPAPSQAAPAAPSNDPNDDIPF